MREARRMKRARTVAPLVLSALGTLAGCTGSFGDRVQEQFAQSVAAGPATAVRVNNVAGEIRIRAWHESRVDVKATKYGNDMEDLRSIAIVVRSGADGISISTNYTGGSHSGGVRYVISVPAAAPIDISNIAGTVDITGVRGNVTVQTQAGTIDADVGRVDGNRAIDLSATTGTIRLTVASDSSATVRAASTVGAFSSNLPNIAETRENIVGSRAEGRIGSGSATIHLSTTTGAIALKERV